MTNTKWPLSRVIECMNGYDSLIMVCRIKTADNVLMQTMHKLCLLPVDVGLLLNN